VCAGSSDMTEFHAHTIDLMGRETDRQARHWLRSPVWEERNSTRAGNFRFLPAGI
jgi:hypothetical protein